MTAWRERVIYELMSEYEEELREKLLGFFVPSKMNDFLFQAIFLKVTFMMKKRSRPEKTRAISRKTNKR